MKLSDQKKLHILAAAEQLFYEQGVDATSMDDIAKLAKVSKRTVYNHFDTKDQLFHAILFKMKDELMTTEAVVFDPSKPLHAQLQLIAEQEVQLLTSDNFLRIAKIAFMQMLKDSELASQLGSNKVGCMTFIEAFLKDAVDANALAIDDIEFAAKQFLFQLKSFIFYPHLYGFEKPTPEQQKHIIEQTITMFLARYTKNERPI
ncbi:TetR/AcrR family transcriptional regulator [Pseudoalteromonas sp. SS15]|uniref:TetR/AcrR family transcriptional regulator n=1 Tax=Pseudoalteromonas sp. SS15 TaxID=3139393 RepID=UPI003BAB31E2